MNAMKPQWTGELKSCSAGKCRAPKKKGRLHIPLIPLPLQFWFHPSSLQFAGLQSGVWHCRSPQASFLASRYETRKMERRVTPIFPSSQNCKASQENTLPTSTFCPCKDSPWILHTGCPERKPWEPLWQAPFQREHLRMREEASTGGEGVQPTGPTFGWHVFSELQLHCLLSPTMCLHPTSFVIFRASWGLQPVSN